MLRTRQGQQRLDQSAAQQARQLAVQAVQALGGIARVAAEEFVAAVASQDAAVAVVMRLASTVEGRHGRGVAEGLVVMGGDGGDELFGGNTRYAKQRIFGAYEHLPASLRKRLLEPLLAGDSWATQVPLLRKVASYVDQARVPMPDRMQSYNLLDRLDLKEVLAPGFLARVDPGAPRRHQREVWNASETPSLVDHMLAFDWRYTLAEADLPKVVGATRLAGMAVGFPLLDERLVDFSMRLPAAYKVRGLKLRWFFKEALRDFLPAQIITKKKQGFGLPFGVWATRDAALMRLAADSLRSLGTRGIVRPQFIDAVLNRHLHAHPGYFGELVWIMMMLEQWLLAHAPSYRADD